MNLYDLVHRLDEYRRTAGTVGMAAAIANAVHHATGVRVRDLPIPPEALLAGTMSGDGEEDPASL